MSDSFPSRSEQGCRYPYRDPEEFYPKSYRQQHQYAHGPGEYIGTSVPCVAEYIAHYGVLLKYPVCSGSYYDDVYHQQCADDTQYSSELLLRILFCPCDPAVVPPGCSLDCGSAFSGRQYYIEYRRVDAPLFPVLTHYFIKPLFFLICERHRSGKDQYQEEAYQRRDKRYDPACPVHV